MKLTTKQLSLSAVFTALTFIVTRFIQIPIPLGYFNIGNSVILLSCVLLPSPCGLIIGSIGSALADLTSYPVYTVPTLIIKFIMPFLFYLIYSKRGQTFITAIIATAVSTLVPLFGYTLTGAILYGGLAAGLAQFPGLFLEYIANIIVFALLYKPIRRL